MDTNLIIFLILVAIEFFKREFTLLITIPHFGIWNFLFGISNITYKPSIQSLISSYSILLKCVAKKREACMAPRFAFSCITEFYLLIISFLDWLIVCPVILTRYTPSGRF